MIDHIVGEYFRMLEEAVCTRFFDCIGHFDLYRRYGCDYFSEENIKESETAAENLLKRAALKNIGIEISTSSLRRGRNDFHPNYSMIEMALRCGINLFRWVQTHTDWPTLASMLKKLRKCLPDLG